MGCGQSKSVGREHNTQSKDVNNDPIDTYPIQKEIQVVRPEVIFITGGSGSGKRTQCDRLKDEYGFISISTGDLLRQEVAKSTAGSLEIEEYMKNKQMVPSAILVKLLQKEFISNGNVGRYLLSGFPRSSDNLKSWNEIINISVEVKCLLILDCSAAVMNQRIQEASGIAIQQFKNPTAKTQNLEEDSIYKQFLEQQKVAKINAEKSPNEIFLEICGLLKNNYGLRVWSKPQIVFVLGGPGSGKRTQLTQLVDDFNFIHLRTGDLIKEELRQGGPNADIINECISRGMQIPSDLMIKVIRKKFLQNNMKGKYLIDGFPRNHENLQVWSSMMKQIVDFKFLLYFECSYGAMQKRLLSRSQALGSNETPETIRKRFDRYNEETKPMVNYYQFYEQQLAQVIDSDQLIGKVYSVLRKVIKSYSLNDDVLEIAEFEQPEKKTGIKDKMLKKQSVIFVLGGLESGKEYQCSHIIQKYPRIRHFSTGDLLREDLQSNSRDAQATDVCIKEGRLVPSDLLVKLILNKIQANQSTRQFLISGFPRSEDNLNSWQTFIGLSIKIKYLLFFDISLESMQLRLSQKTKASGKDDSALNEGKLETYQCQVLPIVNLFEKSNQLIKVDAEGQLADVFLATESLLKDKKILRS